MKKFLLALFAFSLLAVPMAEAGSGYKKPKRHANVERNHGGYKHHNRRVDRHVRRNGNINGNNNRWNGGHNNYYYDNRKNYNNNNGGGNFYNDPYFWGGVAGGLIGGAIIRDQYYYEPECETVWFQVYVPGYGYQNQQQVVCN
jgi:hypothetical protein